MKGAVADWTVKLHSGRGVIFDPEIVIADFFSSKYGEKNLGKCFKTQSEAGNLRLELLNFICFLNRIINCQ